tara:strand:- start:335 stop:733 length:399 start_codon:yes stop_codon:yes gene_type:complete
MNKLFLTMLFAVLTNISSAQFMAITTVNMPEDDAEWEMSNVTDNMGIGYMVNDQVTVGLVKNGEEYDMWGRYYFSDCYAVVQTPAEEMSDNMNIGIGYSYNAWKDLYIDPMYMMSTKENSEGEFKLGISYKF